jgi:hypothetical protein
MPQALVLTAIVIGFATTALYLVVMIGARGLAGTDHVDGAEPGMMSLNALPWMARTWIAPDPAAAAVRRLLAPARAGRHRLKFGLGYAPPAGPAGWRWRCCVGR